MHIHAPPLLHRPVQHVRERLMVHDGISRLVSSVRSIGSVREVCQDSSPDRCAASQKGRVRLGWGCRLRAGAPALPPPGSKRSMLGMLGCMAHLGGWLHPESRKTCVRVHMERFWRGMAEHGIAWRGACRCGGPTLAALDKGSCALPAGWTC